MLSVSRLLAIAGLQFLLVACGGGSGDGTPSSMSTASPTGIAATPPPSADTTPTPTPIGQELSTPTTTPLPTSSSTPTSSPTPTGSPTPAADQAGFLDDERSWAPIEVVPALDNIHPFFAVNNQNRAFGIWFLERNGEASVDGGYVDIASDAEWTYFSDIHTPETIPQYNDVNFFVGLADVSVNQDNQAAAAWIEETEEGLYQIAISRFEDEAFQTPIIIASGNEEKFDFLVMQLNSFGEIGVLYSLEDEDTYYATVINSMDTVSSAISLGGIAPTIEVDPQSDALTIISADNTSIESTYALSVQKHQYENGEFDSAFIVSNYSNYDPAVELSYDAMLLENNTLFEQLIFTAVNEFDVKEVYSVADEGEGWSMTVDKAVTLSLGEAYSPTLKLDAQAKATVVYGYTEPDDGGLDDVFMTNNNEGVWANPVLISDFGYNNVYVELDQFGNAAVAYEDIDQSRVEIFSRDLSDSVMESIHGHGFSNFRSHELIKTADGTLVLVYTSRFDGGLYYY